MYWYSNHLHDITALTTRATTSALPWLVKNRNRRTQLSNPDTHLFPSKGLIKAANLYKYSNWNEKAALSVRYVDKQCWRLLEDATVSNVHMQEERKKKKWKKEKRWKSENRGCSQKRSGWLSLPKYAGLFKINLAKAIFSTKPASWIKEASIVHPWKQRNLLPCVHHSLYWQYTLPHRADIFSNYVINTMAGLISEKVHYNCI